MLDPAFGQRPSLIQRTSSVDTRSEITRHTWMSLVSLLKPREFLVTVDHFAIWRKHLSWAKSDGSELRQIILQRFGTNMVFMSLLLGAEVNVLFNSSPVTTQMRQNMQQMDHYTPEFWVGIVVVCSVVLTLGTLLTTFTAWGMVSSISDANTHCCLRSSIGQYVCFLPSRLTVMALYSFLIWVVMFIFILMPHIWSLLFLAAIFVGFLHIVTVFSSFGRLIMHTGAMGSSPIFDTAFEEELLPRGLHTSLLFKAVDELRKGTSVTRQYKNPSRPIGRVDPVEGDKTSTFVRFNDEKPSTFVGVNDGFSGNLRREDFRDSTKLDRHYSDLSLQDSVTDVLPPTALNRWISQSQDEEDSAAPPTESQRSLPTPLPLQSLTRPPRMPAKASRPGIDQRSLSEDDVVTLRGATPTPNPQGKARPSSARLASSSREYGGNATSNTKERNTSPFSFSDSMPRPSLLNAGGHTLKSIRRMAASLEEDSDMESPHNSNIAFDRSSDDGSLDLCSVPSTESGTERNPPEMVAGDESQRLLPKPSLRPPMYSSNVRPPKPRSIAADENDRRKVERENVQASKPTGPPPPVRARTATADIIDIVSKSISPEKALRTASFDGGNEFADDRQEDELERLM